MMRYTCPPCQRGNHDHCVGKIRAPHGMMGGSECVCEGDCGPPHPIPEDQRLTDAIRGTVTPGASAAQAIELDIMGRSMIGKAWEEIPAEMRAEIREGWATIIDAEYLPVVKQRAELAKILEVIEAGARGARKGMERAE